MPKFVIEREIPDAGKLSAQELQAISQKSCGVLQNIGPKIQWLQSYVTDDKVYCVYIAPDEGHRTATRPTGRVPCQQGRSHSGSDRPDDGRVADYGERRLSLFWDSTVT